MMQAANLPYFAALHRPPFGYVAISVYVINLQSRLCQIQIHGHLAALYDDQLNVPLDRLFPASQFVRRQRPTYPWFDKECRDARRATGRLERASAEQPGTC